MNARQMYPPMPEGWNDAEVWRPDQVFAQIQAGLLNGKSIGWLPTKAHFADQKEAQKNGYPDGALVVEEWLLIKYAVGSIPINPETVVDVVSKTVPAPEPMKVTFTPVSEIEGAMERKLQAIDLGTLIQSIFDRKRGKV